MRLTKHTELIDGRLRIADTSVALCMFRCLLPEGDESFTTTNWTEMERDVFYNVKCDFVETECRSSNGTVVYRYIHIQVIRKETKKFQMEDETHPSVIILIIDSVSSSTGIRALHKTNEVMRLYFQSTLFHYHNKVAENSRPNGFAIFCGNRIEDLDRSFFPYQPDNAEVANSCSNYMPRNETILFDFIDAKYATMIFEDWKHTFNYPDCKAFNETPADHYDSPLIIQASSTEEFIEYFYHKLCEHEYQKAAKYMSSFLKAYDGIAKFSYIWLSSIAHESINGLYHVDEFFANFFRENADKLQGSFIFLMSDHGVRKGSARWTDIGRDEDCNPFLSISVPRYLRKNDQLMLNLLRNSRVHTSHYDVYATFYDIAHVARRRGFENWDYYDFRKELGEIRGGKRAMSLLRPINSNRTCEEMFISRKHCLCVVNWITLNVSSTMASNVGYALIDHINKLIIDKGLRKDCAFLSLKEVTRVKKRDNRDEFLVTVIAEPNDGKYEVLLSLKDGKYTLFSEIDRHDSYGNQGYCVSDDELRPLCSCIKPYPTSTTGSTEESMETPVDSDEEITESTMDFTQEPDYS